MTDRSATKMAIWPFIIVDFLFLGLATLIFNHAHKPLELWEAFALIICTAVGAWSFLTPFLRRNAAALKLAESDNLTNTVSEIKNLEAVAAQISGATQYLGTALEKSVQTVDKSKEIAQKMADESHAFAKFIQTANDNEKAYLRLEVEKLRRSEVDWIQVAVHLLDQVFALHQAAVRSGKPAIIEQISNFQTVCRDVVRRVGLTCNSVNGDTEFDEKVHQLPEGESKLDGVAQVTELLAPGYSYQGRVVRRALVRLQSPKTELPSVSEKPDASVSEPEVSAQKSLF